ncbi:hypothetical protein J1614_006449 [Plenodomus biglobosus]|nr:hypothetical protein J1614_006449 [Plenodomus biglobosus]
MRCTHLCDVEEQERHHEREKTSSFSKGETENGVLEELTPEGGVAGDTLDETTENRSDTDTSTGKTNGGQTSALDLGGSDHGGSGGLGDDATLLDDVAGGVGAEGAAGSNEAVLRGLAGCEMRVNGCWMGAVLGLRDAASSMGGANCGGRTTYQRWRSRGRPHGQRRRSGRWQPL